MPFDEIKPAGGGDYTSLAAWETAATGNDAKCFNGGNLGVVILNNGVSNISIYADTASKHNGKADGGDYARIDPITNTVGIESQENEITIDGLYFHLTGSCSSTTGGVENGGGIQEQVVKNCVFECDATGAALKQLWGKFDSGVTTAGNRFVNNYGVFQSGSISTGSLLRGFVTGANTGSTSTYDEYSHNTLVDNSGNGDNGIRDDAEDVMSEFHNNAVLGFTTPYSNVATFTNASKNASTGASTPGTDPINSLTATGS